MKCIVIYFSQTGNTEKVARAIQAGIKQTAGHCDITEIKEANPKRLYEYDLIGLGSPVYNVKNVWSFIANTHSVGGKHVFAFCTHGGDSELFFPTMIPKLKRRGLVVIGTRDWYGNCYLLHHLDPYPTKGHPDEIDLKEAEDFGREIVIRSWKISAGNTSLIPPDPSPDLPTFEKLPPLPDAKADTINSLSSSIKFYKDKCLYPKCRLCVDNCPMDGIDLSVDPPVIAKPCQDCEFCTRICPTGALDMSIWVEAIAKPAFEKMYPLRLLPGLDKAEAEGRFRRLLPKKDFKYSFDNIGYKQHTKHPQWIIEKGPQ
jgi:flavodoxin/ferredoxin